MHEDRTRSPAATPRTSGPDLLDVPMNSWPRRDPAGNPKASPALKMCRSEPQMPAIVTRTIASVGSSIAGSCTSSTRTSCAPWKVSPFIACLLVVARARGAYPRGGAGRPIGSDGMGRAPHAALADRFRAEPAARAR